MKESSRVSPCCLLAISIYIFVSAVESHAVTYDASCIFKISAQNTIYESATVQTGFIVSGEKGIITALHGVAGKKIIKASNNKGSVDLEIHAVDVAHDVALLSSPNLETKNGLLLAPDNVDYEGLKVKIVGCSLGRSFIEPSWNFNVRSYTKLKDLIPESPEYTDSYNIIRKRNSPDVDKKVFSIEGTFLPGHSGAPVLNEENQVVGIVDGSLAIGKETSWAIRYKDIVWNKKSSNLTVLNQIASMPTPFSCSAFQTQNGELFAWQRPRAGKLMTWTEAMNYVEEMNRKAFMGHSDWRLPAVGELQDLAQFIKSSPGSYSDVDKLYWSLEDFGPYSVEAKAVNLGNARMEKDDLDEQIRQRSKRNDRLAVRLVRSLVQ